MVAGTLTTAYSDRQVGPDNFSDVRRDPDMFLGMTTPPPGGVGVISRYIGLTSISRTGQGSIKGQVEGWVGPPNSGSAELVTNFFGLAQSAGPRKFAAENRPFGQKKKRLLA